MHQNTDWEETVREFEEVFIERGTSSAEDEWKLSPQPAVEWLKSKLQAREEWLKGEIENFEPMRGGSEDYEAGYKEAKVDALYLLTPKN